MNSHSSASYDVIIIGAGAAGLFCAATAGAREQRVLLLDHASKLGEKIRISGGGRCNFTNLHTAPGNYLSHNPHFCKSALANYTPRDFIALIEKHKIAYHEKTLGQLFCDNSAQEIIDMLQSECTKNGVHIQMDTTIESIAYSPEHGYTLLTKNQPFQANSLVIATGGLSIPKIGASDFAYKIAQQFNIPIIAPRPALVPLTFTDQMKDFCAALSGLSIDAQVNHEKTSFREGLLFTHRGLSGPSILQISSYWREGTSITINLAPDHDIAQHFLHKKRETPRQTIQTALGELLPQRLAEALCTQHNIENKRLADYGDKVLTVFGHSLNHWQVKPAGTEGYRKAEVTLGGIDTRVLSSKTMEVKTQSGLYFIGEAVDVTGHLGGYNFQWAWASGYAAGMGL